jgi:RNA polymerase sigma factor (sigma-70 family)
VNLPPFQKLLDAHAREVHRLLVATVGPDHADDCYQETWIAALRAYPRLRDATNLRGWILTVAHRKAIDHVRATRRRPVAVAEVPERAAPETTSAADDGAVWERVRTLPAKQRAAVALRYAADAGYDEISAVMGISQEAARRNVHEAMKRLRLEFEDDDPR